MMKSDLIEKLRLKTDIPPYSAKAVITEIFFSMSETLISGGRIEIRGFGSFEIREYAGHSGRNPKTGVEVVVGPKRSPFFKVGRELKERVASGGVESAE